MSQVYNFGAGPAMLPIPVMEKAKEEFLNYNQLGASIIEISHRSKEFEEVINHADALLTELLELPPNYKILYVHGGAQMQFAAVPLNLLGLKPGHKAAYVDSGNFATLARKEATRYGNVTLAASSEDTNFDRIPEFDPTRVDADTSYIHITSNNTIYGTRWQSFPETGNIPLVADSTSELLSRHIDVNKFGLIYAGLQKNLGPAGLACVIVREDLLGKALPSTPTLLNYAVYADKHSLANTNNTFAIYMMSLVMQWLKDQGGVAAIEAINEEKAQLIYHVIDESDFYLGTTHPQHRSRMNVTFNLANPELLDDFLKQALECGLYALKGHRNVGGVRASIYNAMPMAGCQALVDFMMDFERRYG